MKKIKLTKGQFALVDDGDFEFLNHWKWKFHKDGYAVRTASRVNNHDRQVYMHREINKTPIGFITDHIDRNGLNNQKDNLRTVTISQNAMNSRTPSNNTSGKKGVFWNTQKNKWNAVIVLGQKQIHLGFFINFEDACLARDIGVKKYHVI